MQKNFLTRDPLLVEGHYVVVMGGYILKRCMNVLVEVGNVWKRINRVGYIVIATGVVRAAEQ